MNLENQTSAPVAPTSTSATITIKAIVTASTTTASTTTPRTDCGKTWCLKSVQQRHCSNQITAPCAPCWVFAYSIQHSILTASSSSYRRCRAAAASTATFSWIAVSRATTPSSGGTAAGSKHGNLAVVAGAAGKAD
jgi:hypothetical protein